MCYICKTSSKWYEIPIEICILYRTKNDLKLKKRSTLRPQCRHTALLAGGMCRKMSMSQRSLLLWLVMSVSLVPFSFCRPPTSNRHKIGWINCLFSVLMLYVAWKWALPRKLAHFVLFHPTKKCSFNLLCVLDQKEDSVDFLWQCLKISHTNQHPRGSGPPTPEHSLHRCPVHNALQCQTQLQKAEMMEKL